MENTVRYKQFDLIVKVKLDGSSGIYMRLLLPHGKWIVRNVIVLGWLTRNSLAKRKLATLDCKKRGNGSMRKIFNPEPHSFDLTTSLR